MKTLGRVGVVWWTAVVMATVTCAAGQPPRRLKVGGGAGWKKDVNYTEWAMHERFNVGDWLFFVFDKNYYSVLEVNKTNYEQCNDQSFITNITRGGRDVFNLVQARPYYFLSRGGYCFQGMKLAINVEEYIPPAPAPAKSGAHTNMGRQVILSIAVAIGLEISLVWAFLLKLY